MDSNIVETFSYQTLSALETRKTLSCIIFGHVASAFCSRKLHQNWYQEPFLPLQSRSSICLTTFKIAGTASVKLVSACFMLRPPTAMSGVRIIFDTGGMTFMLKPCKTCTPGHSCEASNHKRQLSQFSFISSITRGSACF